MCIYSRTLIPRRPHKYGALPLSPLKEKTDRRIILYHNLLGLLATSPQNLVIINWVTACCFIEVRIYMLYLSGFYVQS